jgi:hypothetical protein
MFVTHYKKRLLLTEFSTRHIFYGLPILHKSVVQHSLDDQPLVFLSIQGVFINIPKKMF